MEKERKSKSYTLRFAKGNKETFEHIRAGRKTVETRAGTVKYQHVQKGDTLILSCDGEKIEKVIKAVRRFNTISALIKVYKPRLINPAYTTLSEIEAMYYSYPGYKEKIKTHGIVAFEL